MRALGMVFLLCMIGNGDISTADSLQDSSHGMRVSSLNIGNSTLTFDAITERPHRRFSPESLSEFSPYGLLDTSKIFPMPSTRPTINPEYVAKDCTNWINPQEYAEIPSAFTKIPVVISTSSVSTYKNFSLAVVDRYGEQLACFLAKSTYTETSVSVFLGQCKNGELVVEEVWSSLTESHRNDWSCLVKPQYPLSDFFHVEVSAKKIEGENRTEVSFRHNGESEKSLSVKVDSSAEFIYIFAAKIKTAVNMVYYRDGYTASKCQTLDEPVRWNQTVYFLPEEEAKEVRIFISYCFFTKVLIYPVNSKQPHWYNITFGEDPSVAALNNTLFYRNVFINDFIVGNLTITNKHPPRLLRIIKVCSLEQAQVSMTKAIWTHRCIPSTITQSMNSKSSEKNFTHISNISLTNFQNGSNEASPVLNASETSRMQTAHPTINPEYVAKDCTNWINPIENSEIPSAFTKMPVVISVSSVSNNNFSLAVVDRYGKQLACLLAISTFIETSVSVFLGQCVNGEPVLKEAWPRLMGPHRVDWPCLVKPYFSLSKFFHIEISAKKVEDGNRTEVSFRPNGESEKSLSVKVASSAEFVYIFAAKIRTAVNMVYYHDGYTASKCQTLDEPIRWNQTAYFLPEEEATQVKIYMSYCHFTEVLTYSVNPQNSHWYKLTFNKDPSVDSSDILFYRNIFIDDKIIGNITMTNKHPPVLLILTKLCPLEKVKISMVKAIWTNRCTPADIA